LDYDRRVENLSSDAYRLFMLTLYSQQRTMLGVMRWVPADVVPRVRAWDEATAVAALEELQGVGLVAYDQDARLLFNPMALEFSPIRSVNQVKGAWGALQYLPDSPVLLPAARQIMAAAEALDPSAARDLPEIVIRLRARLAGLERLATSGIPMATPCGHHADPIAMASDTHADGMPRGVAADEALITTGCGRDAAPTTPVPPAQPMAMGSDTPGIPLATPCHTHGDGVPLARARPDPSPPIPKPEDPPKAPPPETAEAPAGAAGSKGPGDVKGANRYELLDPRKRDGGSGPNGAATKQAGSGELPGLRSTG
jgi:hypothetical protein